MTQHQAVPEKITEPREYLLKMDSAISMPLGLESVVTVEVAGEKFEACVPAKIIISQDPVVVSAWYAGNEGDRCVIVFPPTSLGTYVWKLPQDALAAIETQE